MRGARRGVRGRGRRRPLRRLRNKSRNLSSAELSHCARSCSKVEQARWYLGWWLCASVSRRGGRSWATHPSTRTYPSRIGRRPALFLLDHISPIFARFFSVFSLFFSSSFPFFCRFLDPFFPEGKWHQKTGGRFRNGPKRPPKEWSPPFFKGVGRTERRCSS